MKRPDTKNPAVMYNYVRGGQKYSTPSVKIAIARKDVDGITVESILDGESTISNLEIIS